jgi:hypothetical protein
LRQKMMQLRVVSASHLAPATFEDRPYAKLYPYSIAARSGASYSRVANTFLVPWMFPLLSE